MQPVRIASKPPTKPVIFFSPACLFPRSKKERVNRSFHQFCRYQTQVRDFKSTGFITCSSLANPHFNFVIYIILNKSRYAFQWQFLTSYVCYTHPKPLQEPICMFRYQRIRNLETVLFIIRQHGCDDGLVNFIQTNCHHYQVQS